MAQFYTMVDLTERQAAALKRWLDELADQQAKQDAATAAAAEREAASEAFFERCYGRVRCAATLVAQMHGPVPAISAERMALATWQAFCDHEGFISPLQIAEYFDPLDQKEEDWEETWHIAYINTIDAIKRGGMRLMDADSASKTWYQFINRVGDE